mgnify:CR=1 FL=1
MHYLLVYVALLITIFPELYIGILLLCADNCSDKDIRNQLLDDFKVTKVVSRYTRNLDMILCYPNKASLNKASLKTIATTSNIDVVDAEEIGLTRHLELSGPYKPAIKSRAKKRNLVQQCSPDSAPKMAKVEASVLDNEVSLPLKLAASSPPVLLATSPAPVLLTTTPAPALLSTTPAPALLTTSPAPALLTALPAAVTPPSEISSQSSITVTTTPSQGQAQIEDYAEDIGILNTVTGVFEEDVPTIPELF